LAKLPKVTLKSPYSNLPFSHPCEIYVMGQQLSRKIRLGLEVQSSKNAQTWKWEFEL